MGMFDTIRCEYPLPDPRHQDLEYQTKDLDCALFHYKITRVGQLVRLAGRGQWGPDRDVVWPLHGDIRIYTHEKSLEPPWVEYEVRFTHGSVEWIRPFEKERQDSEPAHLDWDLFPEPSEEIEPAAESPPSSAPEAQSTDAEDEAEPTTPEQALLRNLRRDRSELEKLLQGSSDHWGYEDPVYRFYHQSFKVYRLQQQTKS